ncbi:MAG: hypothetical protein IPK81_12675 [Rhodospirillales bacterium]|nr:MAG: hypothetical protein IPK81_12675 [Rhodospirillales bacterium]
MTQPRDRGRGPFAPADSSDPTTGQRDPWFFDPPAAASRESAGVETGGPPYDGGVPIAPVGAADPDDGMTPSERFYVRAQNLRREAREIDRAMQSVARMGRALNGQSAGHFRRERDRLEAEASAAEERSRVFGPSQTDDSAFDPDRSIHLAGKKEILEKAAKWVWRAINGRTTAAEPLPPLPPTPIPTPTKPVPPPHIPPPPFKLPPFPADQPRWPTSPVPFPAEQAKPTILDNTPPRIEPNAGLGSSFEIDISRLPRVVELDSPAAFESLVAHATSVYSGMLAASVSGRVTNPGGRRGSRAVRWYNETILAACEQVAMELGVAGSFRALTKVLAEQRGRDETHEANAPGPTGTMKDGSYVDGAFEIDGRWYVYSTSSLTKARLQITKDEIDKFKRAIRNFGRLNPNIRGVHIPKPEDFDPDSEVDQRRLYRLAVAACRRLIGQTEEELREEMENRSPNR